MVAAHFKLILLIIFCFSLLNVIKCSKNESLIEMKIENDILKEKNDLPKIFVKKLFKICPKNLRCVPQIQCPAHVLMKPEEKPLKCNLPFGKHGFCCTTGQSHTSFNNSRIKREIYNLNYNSLNYIKEARSRIADMMASTSQTAKVIVGHPGYYHGFMFNQPEENLEEMIAQSNLAIEQVVATQVLKEKNHIPSYAFAESQVKVNLYPGHSQCDEKTPDCPDLNAKYRTIDGTCNNPHPNRASWGSAGSHMERLLSPAYADGIWRPREFSVKGGKLKSARDISRNLVPNSNRPHKHFNLFLMQFGQFIAHDLTQSRSIRMPDGRDVQCCSEDGSSMLPKEQRHYSCFPIAISPHDEFYSKFNQRCMNFVRLALVPNGCMAGYGRQASQVTHYLDGSPIYGSNERIAASLRTFRDGKLRMLTEKKHDILPLTNEQPFCADLKPGATCFIAGDTRVNQIASLVAVHILFNREHNRIATILSAINPELSDEEIFQETRRIVIAELQHITFNEYLPAIIGTDIMERFSLLTGHQGYNSDYNEDVNPGVTNEFTGAAFRFGHSTVDGRIKSPSGEEIEIPDIMFNVDRMRQKTFYDEMLIGMTRQPMQDFDNAVTHGLSRFLFRGDQPFGLDLPSLNIQRGRDEGLRPYNDYLEVMGHNRVTSFDDFHPELARRLAKVYKHPDDIDLWIGGLLEPIITSGGISGPTFSEIIADQFSRVRHGDRYFYENGPEINPGHFTLAQLNEIRKTSMAALICDNMDYLITNEIQPLAFVRPDVKSNYPIRCDSKAIPRVNLNAWRIKKKH
ncbi:chorion peroxidase isoform X2 [Condylostylus longicornis]|uniref:chorion peroxidase isoform X2 n=1 Tax=Condylostylus longicornis TaxID=2530218 RepID=UPI00244DCBB2|nr:chorion peroxidase isoform X2 [Condylostylus longicornis]